VNQNSDLRRYQTQRTHGSFPAEVKTPLSAGSTWQKLPFDQSSGFGENGRDSVERSKSGQGTTSRSEGRRGNQPKRLSDFMPSRGGNGSQGKGGCNSNVRDSISPAVDQKRSGGRSNQNSSEKKMAGLESSMLGLSVVGLVAEKKILEFDLDNASDFPGMAFNGTALKSDIRR